MSSQNNSYLSRLIKNEKKARQDLTETIKTRDQEIQNKKKCGDSQAQIDYYEQYMKVLIEEKGQKLSECIEALERARSFMRE